LGPFAGWLDGEAANGRDLVGVAGGVATAAPAAKKT
jgi:hypothetical protein